MGTLIRPSWLEDIEELDNNSDNSARIWQLVETEVASRVSATGPVVPIPRVDGPNNAMINAIVAFGINRDGPRPVVVPLVHHAPQDAGTNRGSERARRRRRARDGAQALRRRVEAVNEALALLIQSS